mgnify:CR=1 FL=1
MTDVLTRSHDCDVSGCSASDQQEHLQWMIDGYEVRDSLRVRYSIPYVPTPDNPGARTPFGWRRPIDPTTRTVQEKSLIHCNERRQQMLHQPEILCNGRYDAFAALGRCLFPLR